MAILRCEEVKTEMGEGERGSSGPDEDADIFGE